MKEVKKYKPKIFIISWKNQHKNAIQIAQALTKYSIDVFVVYSDPDPDFQLDGPFTCLRRSNEGFWGDKFYACLTNVDDVPLLIIHADCVCSSWSNLYESFVSRLNEYPAIGVWAPKIEGTPYSLDVVKIAKIPDQPLHFVMQTDAIVFGLAPRIVQRMRRAKYESNLYGWGIDRLFCAAAFVRQLWVVVDESCNVFHPRGRGYEKQQAQDGMNSFYHQFDTAELIYQRMCAEIILARRSKPSSGP